MAEVSIETELDKHGSTLACAKIASSEWEVNIRATPQEFLILAGIRDADWSSRGTIAVGTSAGSPVYWSCAGEKATILVGPDDETWDLAVSIPVSIVDEIVVAARGLTA